MDIKNANSHPFKVAVVGNDNEMYANSHPFKVSIVEGGSTFVTELPETGTPGTMYVLVDDAENPTKAYGIYTYNNGWVLVAQPVDQAVKKVDELPEVGEEGILYYLAKEGDDTYDLYRWIDNSWVKVDTDIKLYNSEGDNTDGAMTQAATTALKGKPKVLTTADYNWPTTGTPNLINVYLLPNGFYSLDKVAGHIHIPGKGTQYREFRLLYVGDGTKWGTDRKFVVLFGEGGALSASDDIRLLKAFSVASDHCDDVDVALSLQSIVDNLTSTMSSRPLSANQGRVLKNLIDSIAIRGAGAPTTSTVGEVGTLYEDTTNGGLYICTDATNPYVWEEVGGGTGGSSYIELTTDDYDYPVNSPDGVWFKNLDPGTYYAAPGVKGYISDGVTRSGNYLLIVSPAAANGQKQGYLIYGWNGGSTADGSQGVIIAPDLGASTTVRFPLTSGNLVQTTGTSTTDVMSQNAVTKMVFNDPASKAQIFISGNGNESIRLGSLTQASTLAIAIGSKNSMVPGNGASATGTGSIAIGANTTGTNGHPRAAGAYSIAIGSQTYAGQNSVAIGYGANATQQGQVDISTGALTTSGYNSSNYRLLTGLYDGQSDHDAVTVGQLNTAIAGVTGAEEITSEDWSALWQ